MKDAYYFTHDSNARTDINIAELRVRHGWSGYGLYWGIIEALRDQSGYKFDAKKIGLLCVCVGCTAEEINPVVETCLDPECGLLVEEDGFIYSPSLTQKMEKLEETRRKRAEAGAKGAGISKSKAQPKQNTSPAQAKDKQCSSSKVDLVKESTEDLAKKNTEDKAKKKAEQKRHYDFVGKRFEEFWKAYPRREARKDAENAFRKIFAYEIPDDQCTTRIRNLGVLTSRLIKEGRERKHVPLPATFLNREDFDIKPEVIEDSNEVEWVEVEGN